MHTQHKSIALFQLMRPLLHWGALGAAYYLAYSIRSASRSLIAFDLDTPWIATQELVLYGAISLIIFLVVGIVQHYYDMLSFKPSQTRDFLKVWWQWMVIVTFIAYFGQGRFFEAGVSRFIVLGGILGALVFVPVLDWLRSKVFAQWIKHKSIQVRILLEDKSQFDIVKHFQFPDYYHINTSIFDEVSDLSSIQEQIVILVWSYTDQTLQELIDQLRLRDKHIYHVGNNYFLQDIVYTHTKFAGVLAMRYIPSQIQGWNAIFKRWFDVVASLLGILVTSPLMLVAAIAIKIDSSWPIFYRQERVGKNGQHFLFTKFRSMYTHLSVGKDYGGAEASKLYQDLVNSHANIRPWELPKIKNDPRVTRVGRRLRASSIDELPNLFAVLRGDMSLVGPRPHLPSEIANYKPRQQRVLSIKPGITWYAQIHGRDTLSFDQEATKELEYIQNRSLWLDMYIILMTFKVIFVGKGK